MTTEHAEEARRAALRSLDPLVGSWTVESPGSQGTVTYAWMEGGGFLVQQIDLVADEGPGTHGVEYIGWSPEAEQLTSHFFAGSGEILEYTYALTGDTLTIWFGTPESPARFVGTFDAARNHNTGAWQWPGGGYESTMTRIQDGGPR